MGSDTYLISSKFDCREANAEEVEQELWIIGRSYAVGLLSLLCFRYYDLKIMENQCTLGNRLNACPSFRYVVPFEVGIKQLHDGLEVLRKHFAGASALDPYVSYFVAYLNRFKSNYLHLRCVLFIHEEEFDLLIHHVLLGIQYPDIKMFYSVDQIERWQTWEKPAASGIMTWSGAIRRLTRLGSLHNTNFPDAEELFEPDDVRLGDLGMCAIGFDYDPPGCA